MLYSFSENLLQREDLQLEKKASKRQKIQLIHQVAEVHKRRSYTQNTKKNQGKNLF